MCILLIAEKMLKDIALTHLDYTVRIAFVLQLSKESEIYNMKLFVLLARCK